MSLAQEQAHDITPDTPDVIPNPSDSYANEPSLLEAAETAETAPSAQEQESAPQPLTTQWLQEMNTALQSHTPDVAEFDAMVPLYDRLNFGKSMAIDSASFKVIDLETAEAFGRNAHEASWILTEQDKEDKQKAATFDAFTPKNDLYEFMGAEWVGRVEKLHPEWMDKDGEWNNAEIAMEAAADARRALQLDATLRERGWNESDIPDVQESDAFDPQAIALLPVPGTPETAATTADAEWAAPNLELSERARSLLLAETEAETETETENEAEVSTPAIVTKPAGKPTPYPRNDLGSLLRTSRDVHNKTVRDVTELGAYGDEESQDDGNDGDDEPNAEPLSEEDRRQARLMKEYEEWLADQWKPSLFEKMRGRVASLGRTAIKLANPVPMINKAYLATMDMMDDKPAVHSYEETDRSGKWRKAALLVGGLGLVYAGVKYGTEIFNPSHVDAAANLPMPSGAGGHAQTALEAQPHAPLNSFDTTEIRPNMRLWTYMHEAGVSNDTIMSHLEDAADKLKETGSNVQWVGDGKLRRLIVDGKDDTASIVHALRPYLTK
jgi:hypothetical protein